MSNDASGPRFDPADFRMLPADAVTRIGLILLATDLVTERDAARLFAPDEAALHANRIAFENPTTPENLRKMEPRIEETAALLAPGAVLSAIYFSCTSGAIVIGEDKVATAIGASHPGVPVVTPAAAAIRIFAERGIRRVAIVTPYVAETTIPIAEHFSANGVDVVRTASFGFEDDRDMARLEAESIVAAATRADGADVEALFLSCTALPALDVTAELEARLKKPVLSSNRAGLWLTRRIAGLTRDVPGFASPFESRTWPAHDMSATA